MTERASLRKLPRSMAERAVTARRLAVQHPELIDTDDEMLPWIYDWDTALWLSFDGNYSGYSPEDKRQFKLTNEERERRWQEERNAKAQLEFTKSLFWSKIRQLVLNRDGHRCQLCGNHGSGKLHIHHIMKVKNGGTDHLDNLITVCPKCHSAADGKLYDPDWSANPTSEEQTNGEN